MIIFLPAAFPVLVDFHFVLVCLYVDVIPVYLCNKCVSYADLVLFIVLVCLFLVIGLPIIWARGLFVRFRS